MSGGKKNESSVYISTRQGDLLNLKPTNIEQHFPNRNRI